MLSRAVSRRRFLAGLGAAAWAAHESLSAEDLSALGTRKFTRGSKRNCVLVDFGDQCILHESRGGFALALTAARIPFEPVPPGEMLPAHFAIVAGGVLPNAQSADWLRLFARRGGTVIYESAAAFAEPPAIAVERDLLQGHFGISVGAPVELWRAQQEERIRADGLPYIHYHRPLSATIRDFSRVIPVSCRHHLALATVGDTAVACSQKIGPGSFIFLGSPLGPHLRFGDPQAHALLKAFLA